MATCQDLTLRKCEFKTFYNQPNKDFPWHNSHWYILILVFWGHDFINAICAEKFLSRWNWIPLENPEGEIEKLTDNNGNAILVTKLIENTYMIVIMSKRLPLKFTQNTEPGSHRSSGALSPVVLNAKGDQWVLWSERPLCGFCVWAICCDIQYYLFSFGGRHPPVFTWKKFQCSIISLTTTGIIMDHHYLLF